MPHRSRSAASSLHTTVVALSLVFATACILSYSYRIHTINPVKLRRRPAHAQALALPVGREVALLPNLYHAPASQATADFLAFYLPTNLAALARFLHAHPVEWLRELHAVGCLVVSLPTVADEDDAKALSDIRTWFPDIVILEEPPSQGGMHGTLAMEALSAMMGSRRFRFAAILSDWAHASPLRLAALASF